VGKIKVRRYAPRAPNKIKDLETGRPTLDRQITSKRCAGNYFATGTTPFLTERAVRLHAGQP